MTATTSSCTSVCEDVRARLDCGIWALVLGGLCGLCPPPAVAQTEDAVSHLKNGDFGQGLVGWSASPPADWSAEDGVVRSSPAPQTQQPSRYVSESTLSQCVDVAGGSSFRLAGRFSHAVPSDRGFAQLNVTWYFDAECRGAGQFGAWIYPRNVAGWQILSKEDVSPALGARSARVSLVHRATDATSTDETSSAGLWDDILLVSTRGKSPARRAALQELPAGVSVVSNGAFDQDLASWHSRSAASWSSGEGAGRSGSARTVRSSSGAGTGGAVLEQCVEVGSNAGYYLAASFKADPRSTQKGRARLRIVWYENPGCHGSARIGEWANPDPETPGWQRVVVASSTRPPSAASALIELIQTVEGPGEFVAYWDDVTLEPR